MYGRRILQLQIVLPNLPIISYNAVSLCGSQAVDASIVVDRAFGFSHTQRHRAIFYGGDVERVPVSTCCFGLQRDRCAQA